MKTILLTCLPLFLTLFTGCASLATRQTLEPVHPTNDTTVDITPLVTQLMAVHGTRVQAITGSYRDNHFNLECARKCTDDGMLTVIFMTPVSRLLTITVTPPHTVTVRKDRNIPSAFLPEYVLFDIALTDLPATAIRDVLGTSFTLIDTPTSRTIAAGDTVFAQITRSSDGKTITFTNPLREYTYTIKELQ